jgi:uncharacterized small protein (DUF1192 family)
MSTTTHEFQPEEVMAFLDGELSAARSAVVAEHLKTCADCDALAADFRQVSGHLNAWGVEPSPAQIEDRVNAVIGDAVAKNQRNDERKPETRRWLGVRIRVWQLAGGTVFIFVLVVALFVPRFERAPLTRSEDMARATGLSGPTRQVQQRLDKPQSGAEGKKIERETPRSASQGFVGSMLGGIKQAEHLIQGPMIARTAELKLVIEKLDAARAEMERILKAHGGYAGQLSATTESDSARTLNATLRIPANQLDGTLAELKKLGRVVEESQKGDEVTQQYVDLTARLRNARATEKRLIEVLQTRTGKVHDVLEVEQEIARVREEIERMDAERKSMENRVQFATLTLTLAEEYNAQLNLTPLSTGGRLRNAVVEGYRDVSETALGIVLFFLQYGPSLLLWTAILFWPARLVWRRLHVARLSSLRGA